MAFDVLFENATFNVPKVSDLEKQWVNVPNSTVRKILAREHQYLHFHFLLLEQLRHTDAGQADSPRYKYKIGYTIRAGFVKGALLLVASICEAVLRSHAEKRGYTFPKNQQRTFGVVLQVWSGKPDVSAIYADLKALKDVRNNIHLFKAASAANGNYREVLKTETAMLVTARRLMFELMKLTSS